MKHKVSELTGAMLDGILASAIARSCMPMPIRPLAITPNFLAYCAAPSAGPPPITGVNVVRVGNWTRNGVPIAGATGRSYTIGPNDIGALIGSPKFIVTTVAR